MLWKEPWKLAPPLGPLLEASPANADLRVAAAVEVGAGPAAVVKTRHAAIEVMTIDTSIARLPGSEFYHCSAKYD